MAYKTPIADDIKILRTGSGLSQPAFAARLFVSTSAVQKWESGENTIAPPVWELAKILFGHPDAIGLLKPQPSLGRAAKSRHTLCLPELTTLEQTTPAPPVSLSLAARRECALFR